MSTTAPSTTDSSAIQVGVLPWVPPAIHRLVRDLRVRWALEEAGWPYRESIADQAVEDKEYVLGRFN